MTTIILDRVDNNNNEIDNNMGYREHNYVVLINLHERMVMMVRTVKMMRMMRTVKMVKMVKMMRIVRTVRMM